MSLEWGSPAAKKFVTNVGLVTSHGPFGPNVSAVEWTHHVGYEPPHVSVSINRTDATHENISSTGEFGVSLAAQDQNVVASVSGMASGREVDKVGALQELGVEFEPARRIGAPLVRDAALQLECRVVEILELGDHTTFVGEVLDVRVGEKEPLAYHGGTYYRLTETVPKPPAEERARIKAVLQRHAKVGVPRRSGVPGESQPVGA